ncbi:hypothetical protein CASFOL_027479 [Castilleja foliolosa]|uniref:Uncharacterized protein n=1 Tax=Castilleja foliolosa TaxID=1961234 RepID=A0ABD3CEX7_9LAMI
MNSGEDGAGHMSCRSSDQQPSESVKVAGSGRHDPAGEDGQALLHHYHLSAVKSSGGPSGFWVSIKCSDSSSPNKNRGFGPKSRKADDKKQQSSSTLPNRKWPSSPELAKPRFEGGGEELAWMRCSAVVVKRPAMDELWWRQPDPKISV